MADEEGGGAHAQDSVMGWVSRAPEMTQKNDPISPQKGSREGSYLNELIEQRGAVKKVVEHQADSKKVTRRQKQERGQKLSNPAWSQSEKLSR